MKHASLTEPAKPGTCALSGGSLEDTAKQGQTRNKAIKRAYEIRVTGTTETNYNKRSDPGLSSENWKPLVGHTKPRPPKIAGHMMVS